MQFLSRRLIEIALAGSAVLCIASEALAEQAHAGQLPELKQLTIEELLNVDVTLPSRRPVRVMEVPSAVAVLTNEEIWRSGSVSIPETLRAVPGVFVGRSGAATWVISSRGFATSAPNKMLVMIDGRSVYSPLFGGVLWEHIDYVLADVDRIEVIRGPGTSFWGSNAVNGVINVVSKSAKDTQGTFVSAVTGAEEHLDASFRHGGRAGAGYYRIFGKFTNRDDAHFAGGGSAQDAQKVGRVGARFDFGVPANAFTLQGEVFGSRVDQPQRDNFGSDGANILARWTRQLSSTNGLQLQVYYDRSSNFLPNQFDEVRDTFDVDYEQRLQIGGRHALTWGAGARVSLDDTTPAGVISFSPEDRTTSLRSAFLQDEVSLPGDVAITAGLRLEHNTYSGVEPQPVVRVRWMPDTTQNVWAGISRAVRLPARADTDVRVATDRLLITGNADFLPEEVTAYQLGYRVNPLDLFSADVVVFYNTYDRLRTEEPPLSPDQPVVLGNGLDATTAGIEATLRVMPTTWMRFTAASTFLAKDLTLDPGSRDPTGGRDEAIDPKRQWLLHARFDLPRRTELDAQVRQISALPVPGVPAYAEATIRFAWRPSELIEVAVIGRDIFHDEHIEFVSALSLRRTAVERALFTRVTFAF